MAMELDDRSDTATDFEAAEGDTKEATIP